MLRVPVMADNLAMSSNTVLPGSLRAIHVEVFGVTPAVGVSLVPRSLWFYSPPRAWKWNRVSRGVMTHTNLSTVHASTTTSDSASVLLVSSALSPSPHPLHPEQDQEASL